MTERDRERWSAPARNKCHDKWMKERRIPAQGTNVHWTSDSTKRRVWVQQIRRKIDEFVRHRRAQLTTRLLVTDCESHRSPRGIYLVRDRQTPRAYLEDTKTVVISHIRAFFFARARRILRSRGGSLREFLDAGYVRKVPPDENNFHQH